MLFSFDTVLVDFSVERRAADAQQFGRFGDTVLGSLERLQD